MWAFVVHVLVLFQPLCIGCSHLFLVDLVLWWMLLKNDLTRVRHVNILKIDRQKPIITHAVDGLTKRLIMHVHVSFTARSTIDRVLQSCFKIIFNKYRSGWFGIILCYFEV